MRHTDVADCYEKQAVLKKSIRPSKIPGETNHSDVFTKHVTRAVLQEHWHKFEIRTITAADLCYNKCGLIRMNKLSDLKRHELPALPDPVVPKSGMLTIEHLSRMMSSFSYTCARHRRSRKS